MSVPAGTLRRAIAAHQLSYAEAAAKLEISELYLSCILTKRCAISANVAVRAEMVLGLDAQKVLIDQALMELTKARLQLKAAQETVTP